MGDAVWAHMEVLSILMTTHRRMMGGVDGVPVEIGKWGLRHGLTGFGLPGHPPWPEAKEGDGVLAHRNTLQPYSDHIRRSAVLGGLWDERNDVRLPGLKATWEAPNMHTVGLDELDVPDPLTPRKDSVNPTAALEVPSLVCLSIDGDKGFVEGEIKFVDETLDQNESRGERRLLFFRPVVLTKELFWFRRDPIIILQRAEWMSSESQQDISILVTFPPDCLSSGLVAAHRTLATPIPEAWSQVGTFGDPRFAPISRRTSDIP
ncbi:uncharacterized protein EI90DRAFT_3025305 [Cantharellus anzutake]|uniref:uncharacterized protein n=1 Tax=Cantharellus anzutake TaxID=1750568 RepID=UPI001906968D|nr:uncharacterized protein EI90DRAFT_3025305 [Cantharellus anzutake]KAF8309249.1 hypothetical protein EI90DRAFT_3025305 [Cantharellus anzutake]